MRPAGTGAARRPSRPPPLLTRPVPRRIVAGLAVALVVFGAGMLVYPLTTDIYTQGAQSRLRREFDARVTRPSADSPAPLGTGALAVIGIAKLELDAVVIEGTDAQTLRSGPGHYAATPQPCTRGNVGIAGHRTTYGRPFRGIDELVPGDEIVLRTPGRTCAYEVIEPAPGKALARPGSAAWVTRPNDWSVVAALSGSFLTLTTCHPPNSAAERLVVRARLVETHP